MYRLWILNITFVMHAKWKDVDNVKLIKFVRNV